MTNSSKYLVLRYFFRNSFSCGKAVAVPNLVLRQDETGQVRQLKAAGCEKVFREKVTGTTADRPQLRALMKKLASGDVVITPAVDRLSRDTTDLLIIARDMQRAGAGIRSLAEPFLDTTSDFAEIIFAILGVAAKLERRRIL